MDDNVFKEKVFLKKIAFKSGGCIECDLEVINKYDEYERITQTSYIVHYVNKYLEQGEFDKVTQDEKKKVTKQEELF